MANSNNFSKHILANPQVMNVLTMKKYTNSLESICRCLNIVVSSHGPVVPVFMLAEMQNMKRNLEESKERGQISAVCRSGAKIRSQSALITSEGSQ